MPPFLVNLIFLIREFLRIPLDVLTRTQKREYVLATDVQAPKDITWAVVSANKIKFEGSPLLELDTEPDPKRPGVFTGVCRYGERSLAFSYQILEEKPGEALVVRLLMDECDPIYHSYGENYITAVSVEGVGDQSQILNSSELTHEGLASRFLVPISIVRGLVNMKRTAETRAGNGEIRISSQLSNAVVTGALTMASFSAMFGASTAALLLVLILIHELGHVVAMRWAGIPVRGIYFVPFFGGVAVGEGIGATQVARGLVALMGPGLSILTTLLFFLLATQNGNSTMANVALMSALLNGFNLLPILPLDGGRILQVLLSRADDKVTRIVQGGMLLIGFSLALFLGDWLLGLIMMLIAPSFLAKKNAGALSAAEPEPISRGDAFWLFAGYAATFVFYFAITAQLWGAAPSAS